MLDRLTSLLPRRTAAPDEPSHAGGPDEFIADEWDEAHAQDDTAGPESRRREGLARRIVTSLSERAASLWRRRDDAAETAFPIGEEPMLASHLSPHFNLVAREGFLTIEGLEKSFGSRKVVEHVSLELMRGEAVGLLGPNGAGKTTVFYMITGLLAPDAGHIYLDGHDVTQLPMYRRARLGVGYLPQEASIFRGLNVEDNVRAVLEVIEPDKARRQRELDALLEEFNIARLRKTPAIALSGGERRRCEIARSLAGRPNYMLLDEPFAGIDPIAVGDIQELVRHLKSRGIGVLITDHNVRETLGLIDRAYIIHAGRVLMEGSADDVVSHPDVRRLYLGEDFRL
ncbi:MAG: LPS export ABC transporter ATP-binding protein [Hyphomicrobiales bacterium]